VRRVVDHTFGFVGMKQKGMIFWQHVHSWFHERKHYAPYNLDVIHDRNAKSLLHRWYTISNVVMKYCSVIATGKMSPTGAPIMEIASFASW
jgi:hypothetical protein